MFLISTRKRNSDNSFGHERILKGQYAVYQFAKSSDGKEAKEKTLADIPVDKDMLLLVHGFNNDFEQVTAAYLNFAGQIRSAGFDGNIMGFTWPSYGAWFQYFGDVEQVEYAAFGLLNFLLAFRPLLGEKKFHANTHSMGAHLLIRALAAYSRIDAIAEPLPGRFIVDEISFFAADVSNEILERGEDGNIAAGEASRLTSYFSYRDPVLGISQVVNRDGRLGLAGAQRPNRLPRNAFQIDCTTLIESHSGYRGSKDVMADLVEVLRGTDSNEIEDRRTTGDKNTFALGPEKEVEVAEDND